MYLYQKKGRYFAQIAAGLEEPGMEELSALGAESVEPGFRGAFFHAGKAVLYRINYNSRLIGRVLAPLTSFSCRSPEDIYRSARNLKWQEFFHSGNTFAVFANVSNSNVRHSKFAGLRLKDGVADAFKARSGRRPSVDAVKPDLWINLYVENNRGTINLDVSGGPLYRRGYRKKSVEAPMQETLASAVIRLSEWDGFTPLHDPMCGSGTLLAEALMKYCRIPSGFLRTGFGFEFLPDFDSGLWRSEKTRADNGIRALPGGLIFGSDISKGAVAAARTNLLNLPGGGEVCVEMRDFESLPGIQDAVIVCNPPYGIRTGRHQDLGLFYKRLGDFLKNRCTGSLAYIYFGNREMIKKIGLRPTWKKPIRNGGLDGRLVKYEMY